MRKRVVVGLIVVTYALRMSVSTPASGSDATDPFVGSRAATFYFLNGFTVESVLADFVLSTDDGSHYTATVTADGEVLSLSMVRSGNRLSLSPRPQEDLIHSYMLANGTVGAFLLMGQGGGISVATWAPKTKIVGSQLAGDWEMTSISSDDLRYNPLAPFEIDTETWSISDLGGGLVELQVREHGVRLQMQIIDNALVPLPETLATIELPAHLSIVADGTNLATSVISVEPDDDTDVSVSVYLGTRRGSKPVGTKYAGGSGTAQDPYKIAAAADLIALGESTEDYSKQFVLVTDIDLAPNAPGGKVFDKALIARGDPVPPGDLQGPAFTGVLDGKGHTVSHLTIVGEDYLGLFGRLGWNGRLSNLRLEDVSISGNSYVGGLVGDNDSGSITASSSSGSVSGTGCYVGGLVGQNTSGSIADCYSSGSVSSTSVSGAEWVGGLVGWNHGGGTLTASYSTAAVKGAGGGLVGTNWGTIVSSYSSGSVTGDEGVGGLVGWNRGSITRCYNTGPVTGTARVGGLVGENGHPGSITASHSSGSVSGTDSCVGGLVGANESGSISGCDTSGSVTGNDSVGGLVGDTTYGTITNCSTSSLVTGSKYVGGLVGYVWYANLTTSYSNSTVVGGDQDVGGLVGLNIVGRIAYCHSAGEVRGGSCAGGLVGQNANGGIADCYSSSPVTGDELVGGLVGLSFAGTFSVARCYSIGPVKGNKEIGGLVGSNCQPNIYSSFWDTETSGLTKSAGGTGKTTAQMQTAKTFLDAGWDFLGETTNGLADLWRMEGKNYPQLAYESWAFFPDPPNDATDVVQAPTLSWLATRGAVAHDVYFGEDQAAVAKAVPGSSGIYRGRQAVEAVTYSPGTLKQGKTYHWRIDEVNEAQPNSPRKGSVWTFSTFDIPIVAVLDDFESYNDMTNCIVNTWVEGWGAGGNGTGSIVGNLNGPFAQIEQEIIMHNGRQSMPMDYNNTELPYYSEAQRTWEMPQDWTKGGTDTLTLYFRGKADNSREPLYVGIQDIAGRKAVVVQPDAEAVLATDWLKWHIAFADLRAAGVDVAAVREMVIGVGKRQYPKPGGTGRIYIDDIRLTRRMP